MNISQPEDVFVIEDLETLKVLADPLRAQILEHLVMRAQTVKEVAARMGLAPSRLYYHINLLEEHGLIQVVDQRMVANLVEKVYRASAYDFELAPALLNFDTSTGKENINDVVLSTLETTREDFRRSLEARTYALERGAQKSPRSILINRLVYRLPDREATELQRRLHELARDFEAAAVDEDWDREEAHVYAFMATFYPRFDYPQDENLASQDEQEDDDAAA